VRKTLSFAVISRLIANLFGVATAFISIHLYNRYVTKEIYGTILVGLQLIGYIQLMSGGFRMALNQQTLAEPDAASKQSIARFGQTLQSYFFIIVMLGGMIGMTAYGQLPKSRATDIPLLVFVSAGAAAALTFQAGSQLALLVAFGEQVTSSLIQGVWGILTMTVLWISFALGSGVWAFPLSNGIGALLVIIIVRIALLCTKNDVPLFVWHRERDFLARFKGIWKTAFDSLYSQILTVLVFTLDIILVGILVGPGPAAVYGIVTRIMAISRQVLQSLSEASWPRLAQEQDSQRRAQTMRKVDRLNAWLIGCWYGAMAITLLPFLGWLVKPDWVAGPLLTALILARSFVISLSSAHSYGLLGAGRFRDLSQVLQQEVSIGLIAGGILSWTFGVIGTAIAFLGGSLAAQGWQMTYRYFRFEHDTHWLSEWFAVTGRGLLSCAVSAAIAFAAWSLVRTHVGNAGWLAVPVGGIAFGIPAAALLLRWRISGKIP